MLLEEYYCSLHRVLKKEGRSKYSLIVSRDMGERLFPNDVSDFDSFVSGMHDMITERLQMVDTMEITRSGDNICLKIRGCVLCPLNTKLCKSGIEPGCLIPGLLFAGLRKAFKNSFHISAKSVHFEKKGENNCDWIFHIRLEPTKK